MSRPERKEQADSFVPFVDIGEISDGPTLALLEGTKDRLGFLPNSYLVYSHRPHLLREVARMNNVVMRHPSNLLSEEFKYRMAFVVSRNQGCRYCCAHEAHAMKRKWRLTDDDLVRILEMRDLSDEREKAALEFVHAASTGPEFVTEAIRNSLAAAFTPEEIVEIACTLGFWSFYNRVHSSLAIPIEDHLAGEAHWVDVGRPM